MSLRDIRHELVRNALAESTAGAYLFNTKRRYNAAAVKLVIYSLRTVPL
jgi:hypothetical protein